jgi:hypothetical protein
MPDDPTNPPAPAAPTPPAPAADKAFSQADVDRIVADRLGRERGKFADYDDLKAKAGEFDKLQQANASDLEKAVAAARKEGMTEAQQAANARLIQAEVRARAAGKLADPADAARMLDLAGFKIGDDGEPDGAAIDAAIGELVKAKPYLAAKAFQGTGDGGAPGREPATGPKQYSEAEFKAMSPDQRVKARQEGRLNAYLGIS